MLHLMACQSTDDLINESQPIPFLSGASETVIDKIDAADPELQAHQRLIWKIDKEDGIAANQIIQHAVTAHLGGLILNGYTIQEYIDIRTKVDQAVEHPLFYGTEEVLMINGQFSDADEVIPPMMAAASYNNQLINNLNDQFLLQQLMLGINFSISINNQSYSPDQTWQSSYDFINGDAAFYKERINNLNDNNTLSVLKSFDEMIVTQTDSTTNIDSIYQRISPFKQSGLSAMMVDNKIIQTATEEIKTFFQNTLGFSGLLVSEINEPEQVQENINKGIDLLIVDDNEILPYLDLVKMAVTNQSSKDKLESIQKILLAKYWMSDEQPNSETDYKPWMAIPAADKIDEESSILINNHKNLLPFTGTYKRDFRMLSYGPSPLDTMEYVMRQFANHKRNFYSTGLSSELKTLNLARYRFATTIVTLEDVDIDTKKDSTFIHYINQISTNRKVVLVNFGNPNNLIPFNSTVTKLQFFRRNDETEVLAAHILFGGAQAPGHLPVSLSKDLLAGTGITSPTTRWRYVDPEHVGIDQKELDKIWLVAREGIQSKAFPGCQVFAVKNGNVIYNKSYGQHTYAKKDGQAVKTSDIYDIASVTKVAATTLSMMKLHEEGKIKLNDKVSKYLTIDKGLQIGDIKIKELLTHTSGLQAGMPLQFIIEHKNKKKERHGLYKSDSLSTDYPITIARNFYYSSITHDSIWDHVAKLSAEKKKYKYSDVNMYLLQKIIEKKTGQTLDAYTSKHFYKQLGLTTIGYEPLKRFDAKRIVPTAKDKRWRGQTLDGYVHDPTAALLGGVSGNAGLFSNAHDLAVIGQMMLNGGEYGGRQYFSKETVDLFTKASIIPNRAYGWDSNGDGDAKVGKRVSTTAYGHLGFTGTAIWIDPQENLVYVFLSNRIHPEEKNNKLIKYRFRQRIQDVIYKAIEKGKERVEGGNIDAAVVAGVM